jgi:hypothetical protein
MNEPLALKMRQRASWLLGPLLAATIGALGGRSLEPGRDTAFFDMPVRIDAPRNAALEGAVFSSVANATWAFADETTVRRVLQSEIQRLESHGGPAEARAVLRFAVIDTNPDGRKALFARACTVDPSVCENLGASQRREAEVRFVPPGNVPWFETMREHPALPSPH